MDTLTKPSYCVLYTFIKEPAWDEAETACRIGLVKVARVTAAKPEDWYSWPDEYRKNHPQLRLLEIASIEFIDERNH